MNQWVSIISAVGGLIIMVSAFRAHRVGGGKTLIMVLTWIAIFLLTAALFSVVSPGGRP